MSLCLEEKRKEWVRKRKSRREEEGEIGREGRTEAGEEEVRERKE